MTVLEGISLFNIIILGLGLFSAFIGLRYFRNMRRQNLLKKWNEVSNSKVILHGMYGGKELPSPSPFVLKLETYLRMAKIPYEIDESDIFGEKGKTPWISYKGKHMGDSQMIIEFLGKKLDKRFGDSYTDEQKAIATAVRIMLEEYVYWGGVLWRFAYGGKDTLQKVLDGKITFKDWLIFIMIAPNLKSMAWNQGLGRHSEQEVLNLMTKCLRSVSKLLGTNKYLLGEEICEDDCAIFGQLASAVFMKNSPFEELLQGELRNIHDYCIRIKILFWPDFNQRLSK